MSDKMIFSETSELLPVIATVKIVKDTVGKEYKKNKGEEVHCPLDPNPPSPRAVSVNWLVKSSSGTS